MSQDRVDRIIEQWGRERPDLDVSPMGVIGRLHRVALLLDEQLAPIFAEAGLGPGDFDVLASLRRAGAPYELTASEIAEHTMVTSGATTKRVDRLERIELVARRVAESDGRSRLVRLTPKGVDLVDRMVEAHIANEHRLVEMLGDVDRARLAGVLKRWGQALEG